MKKILFLLNMFIYINLINAQNQNIDLSVEYHSCTGCNGSNPVYDLNPTPFNSLAISSDYGRRDCTCSTLWHRGIDYNGNGTGGDGDLGYHLLAIDSGTVAQIRGNATYKYIVIDGEGNNDFGYGHIFGSNDNSVGNLTLKSIIGENNAFAIIYHPTDTTIAISAENGDQVVFNGDTLTTTNRVARGQVIAPLGNSGTGFAHLHLYKFDNPTLDHTPLLEAGNCNDPLHIVAHEQPNYIITVDSLRLKYGNSASIIRVKANMNPTANSGSGGDQKHDGAVMNVDDVEVFIKQKQESNGAYSLIKGPNFDTKLSFSGRLNTPFAPNENVMVNQIGSFNPARSGMKAFAYGHRQSNISGATPYDHFYFADFATRIHKNDVQGDTQTDYAAIIEDARYPDEEYYLYAKATTVRDSIHISDTTSIGVKKVEIDNFRPYITHLEVREGTGIIAPLIYQGQWDWDGTNLQLGPFSNPIANKIPPHTDGQHNLEIFLKTSEYMKELTIDIVDANGSYGQSFSTTSNTEKTEWTITIPASAIPSTAFGDQTIHITGKDRANNDVLGFNTQYSYAANQLPHRVGSGSTYTVTNWSVAFPTTTDQIHIFEISDCEYNEGGNKKSGNNCLADFTAIVEPYQNTFSCGSTDIPYVHPLEGGFLVRNSIEGTIKLDASISTGIDGLFFDYEWYFYPDNPISFNPNGATNQVYWTTPGDKVIELRIQCDGACSTKRINVAVAESPCTETKTPVFEPDQLVSTDIVASFLHPSACEYVGQANCPNTGNFNNGEIITNPNYFGASGCYELDVYEVVGSNNPDVVVVQNLYETDAYVIDCLEEGIYRVVMKDNISSCIIEQFVYLRDKNPVIAFDVTPSYIGCDGNTDKGMVSAYIEEPLGCATMVEIEGGGEGPASSIDLAAGNQNINIYLDGNIYLQNQSIEIPQEQAESELSLSYNVTSTSGSGQCDGSVSATASNGSGNYTYTVDGNSNLSNLCTGQHQLTAIDTETTCSISTTFTVHAQINKPNPDVITVFTIHPNPFDDWVNISTTLDQLAPGDNSPIPLTISIYNSSGGHILTVYTGNLAPQQNHTFPVDVSNFSSGTYIFTIEALGEGESILGIKN